MVGFWRWRSGGRIQLDDARAVWGDLVLVAAMWMAARKTPRVMQTAFAAIQIPAIEDRETLVAAVDGTAMRHFGSRSRFWNHRQLFSSWRLPATNDINGTEPDYPGRGRDDSVLTGELSHLYEKSRYAEPNFQLTSAQIARARELLGRLGGHNASTLRSISLLWRQGGRDD
jgi:hypothetical protein